MLVTVSMELGRMMIEPLKGTVKKKIPAQEPGFMY